MEPKEHTVGGKLRRVAVEEFENTGFVNRKKRFEMYRSYTIMVHGRGATRTPLPLCVEIKIGKNGRVIKRRTTKSEQVSRQQQRSLPSRRKSR